MAPRSEMTELVLPFGDGTIRASVEERHLIGQFSPQPTGPCSDVGAELRRALDQPIAQSHLHDLVRNRRNVLLVADDMTRLTPVDRICLELLEELNRAGVGDNQVEVLIALGTHRRMTSSEIETRFGAEVLRRVPVYNHPWQEEGELVGLGDSSNGTPVSVCGRALEADVVIGIGSIVPHHIPGFSGGGKIIQPGITGAETTGATHLLSTRAESSYLGQLENPVRAEMEEIAERVGLSAVLNCVLNASGELVRAFYGDPRQAFREGAAFARRIYGARVPRRADIVVAGSCPCDIEFWQAHKSLYPADMTVRAGGTIILVTPCPEGVSQTHCEMLNYTSKPSAEILDLVERGKIADRVSGALALAWARVREHAAVSLVSPGISKEDARALGFRPFSCLQDALGEASRRQGLGATVLALTHAPDTLPIVGT